MGKLVATRIAVIPVSNITELPFKKSIQSMVRGDDVQVDVYTMHYSGIS